MAGEGDVERMLYNEGEGPDPETTVPLADWLDTLEAERDAVIMRLRQIDRVLVKHGRLSSETIPRRNR